MLIIKGFKRKLKISRMDSLGVIQKYSFLCGSDSSCSHSATTFGITIKQQRCYAGCRLKALLRLLAPYAILAVLIVQNSFYDKFLL